MHQLSWTYILTKYVEQLYKIDNENCLVKYNCINKYSQSLLKIPSQAKDPIRKWILLHKVSCIYYFLLFRCQRTGQTRKKHFDGFYERRGALQSRTCPIHPGWVLQAVSILVFCSQKLRYGSGWHEYGKGIFRRLFGRRCSTQGPRSDQVNYQIILPIFSF